MRRVTFNICGVIYAVQIISILFAISVAKHDAPAANHFENFGVTPKETSIFHRYNFWLKFFFCLCTSVAVLFISGFTDGLNSGLLSFAWIYLVFDPALNLALKNKPWYYLGKHDADGRFWLSKFGKNAGVWKAAIILAFIATLNYLIIINIF